MKQICLPLAVLVLAIGAKAASKIAGTNAPAEFTPQMRESTYSPTGKRDPFQRTDQRVVTTATTTTLPPVVPPKQQIPPSLFRLQAIVRDQRGLLAVINDEYLEWNKSATMQVGNTKMKVKAVEIGSDRVVLEVEDQKVEVRLEEPTVSPKPK